MKTKQTVILIILAGLFVGPEMLWSPVFNFVYQLGHNTGLVWRSNILERDSNWYSFVLGVQLFGALLTAVYLFLIRKNLKTRVLVVMMGLCLIAAIITFFSFGLSISLRHVGF